MQHLSSKILAAIVACSATMLFSGMNVHASVENNQQSATVNHTRTMKVNSLQNHDQTTAALNVKQPVGHHYTYQNLSAIKSNQFMTARLGAKRGRRAAKKGQKKSVRQNKKVANKNKKQSNRKQTNPKKTSRHSGKKATRKGRRAVKSHKKAKVNHHKMPKNPKVVYLSKRNIHTQKKSAVNHYSKKVSYVNNDQPANFQSLGQYGDSDYARLGTPIDGTTQNNSQITFHRVTFIPKKLGNNQFYSPQGLVVVGHYAYVITNATNSYEASHNDDSDSNRQAPASYIDGDDSTGTSPYKVGASQIIRINLNSRVKDYNNNLKAARRNIKVGSVFYGGHGQGLAYNPKTGQLWLLDNISGQVTKSAVSLINLRTLVPELRINFHFGNTTIGDDLAFDRKGNALNATEAGSDSFATLDAVKLFTGKINPKGIHMNLVKQALQYAPSSVMQGLTYNPRNNRFYILGDDSITSIPANKLGHLSSSDVWNTQFDTTREFEGLSFDRKGNAYLLVSRSPEILKAYYNKGLEF